MAKPLRTEFAEPGSRQFTDFGVLDDGRRNKGSIVTSIVINVLVAIIVILLGMAAKKVQETRPQMTMLVAPVMIKPAPPILTRPRDLPLPPPRPPKPVETPPKIEAPTPEVKTPAPVPPAPAPAPKVVTRVPEVAPAPPKRVIAPAAPTPVNLGHPRAASVPNNSPRPAPVALGRADNPIAPSNRPATAAINLGQRGLAGMPASNTGSGARATAVHLGSGSPGGTELAGNGTRGVQGVNLGVRGGTGNANSTGRLAGPVHLGVAGAAPQRGREAELATSRAATTPKVIYKPRPEYTAEARARHVEGTVSVRLRVTASGAVQVLGILNGLGYGLDQAAEAAVRNTRFQPAHDASGRPVAWEGVVNVAFQLAS